MKKDTLNTYCFKSSFLIVIVIIFSGSGTSIPLGKKGHRRSSLALTPEEEPSLESTVVSSIIISNIYQGTCSST